MIAAYAIGATKGYVICAQNTRLHATARKSRSTKLAGAVSGREDLRSASISTENKARRRRFRMRRGNGLMASIEGKARDAEPQASFFPIKAFLENLQTSTTWKLWPTSRDHDEGGDWFASMGTEKSNRNKGFCHCGQDANAGLIEIPMGMPLRKIVEEIGAAF